MSHSDRLQEMFATAVEIESQRERKSFLDRACADDDRLRRDIEGLLRAHDQAGPFLRDEWNDPDLQEPGPDLIGTTIGPYRLVRRLGAGGFGVVYVAEQTEPFRRQVALKVIKPGMDTREVIARFNAERQALAMMDHPNIARVLGAGTTAHGHPYFVMELIDGLPITDFCDRQRIDLNGRLRLFADVCHAVQHAHQKGIIHRDLKPSNVLVTEHAGRQVVKVIDFGVAKALHQPLTNDTLLSRREDPLGTPLYMSPEQATAEGSVDTRSDVYSLGVLLYELLTGTTPFPRRQLHQAGLEEIRRILATVEPPKPSSRILELDEKKEETAAARGVDSRRLENLIRGDLDWLVMKALEKNPDRRYPTASALADDVERFQRHEPIDAGPPTRLYRIGKLARRNRAAISAAAMMLATLVVGASVATWQAIRATTAENLAQDRLVGIEQEQVRTRQALAQAEAAEAEQRRLRNQAEARDRYSRQLLYASDLRLAGQAFLQGDARGSIDLLNRQLPEPSDSDRRGFEWWLLRHQGTANHSQIEDSRSGICAVRFDSTGKYLITGHYNGKIHLWDGQSLKHQRTLAGHKAFANGFDVSPDGTLLASAGDDHLLRIWDLETGTELANTKADAGHVHRVFFTADQQRLISSGEAPEIKVWDLSSLAMIDRWSGFATAEHHGVKHRLDISPDRKRCVAADQFETARVYDLESGELICTLELGSAQFIRCLRFSHDGRRIAGGRYNQDVTLWDAESGNVIDQFKGHLDDIQDLAFHPHGHLLASCDKSGVVRTWSLPEQEREIDSGQKDYFHWPSFFVGHDERVYGLDFSADGETLVTGCRDGTLRSWKAERIRRHATGDTSLEPQAVWIDEDQTVVSGEDHLEFWNLKTGARQTTDTFDECIQSLAVSTDRKWIASGHEQGTIRIWDTGSRTVTARLEQHEETIHGLAFQASGSFLISCGQDGRLLQWDVASGTAKLLRRFEDSVKSVACSPSEPIVSVAVQDDIYLFRLDDDASPVVLRGHQNSADCLVFSPDGRWLASGSDDRTVRLWDVTTASERHVIYAHRSKIESIAFSPDGQTIASGDKTGNVSFSHVATGRFLCTIDLLTRWNDLDVNRENPWISDLKFSPDGTALVASVFRVGHLVLQGTPSHKTIEKTD